LRHAVLVHGEDVEKRAKLFTTPVMRFAPRRAIWQKGLALLRLAERAGIAPWEAHFRYCPPLARLPMTDAYRETGLSPGPRERPCRGL
jgi:hypothetical protein